jgi:hypothetical protein
MLLIAIIAQVVPLYCFDPRQFIATPWGNPKTGAYRAQFLLESVLDLKQGLRQLDSDLMIHMGPPEEALQGDSPSDVQQSTYPSAKQLSLLWLMHALPAPCLQRPSVPFHHAIYDQCFYTHRLCNCDLHSTAKHHIP